MNIAIFPARSGSKRIKNKNIKNFFSKPIIYYSLKIAKNSKLFDLIVTSSDSDKILNLSKKNGSDVCVKRPKKLSDDKTPTREVIVHAINFLEKKLKIKKINMVCCIYPTSIFLKKKYILKAFELQKRNGEYVLCATKFHHPIQRSFKKNKNNLINLNFLKYINYRTQDLAKNYYDAGMLYLADKKTWLNKKKIISNSSSFVEIPANEFQDLDEVSDWKIAKNLWKSLNK